MCQLFVVSQPKDQFDLEINNGLKFKEVLEGTTNSHKQDQWANAVDIKNKSAAKLNDTTNSVNNRASNAGQLKSMKTATAMH